MSLFAGYCISCGIELPLNRGETCNRIEDVSGGVKLFCNKCHKSYHNGENIVEHCIPITNRFEILDL